MSNTDCKYRKLINETNRLIKSLSASVKNVDPHDIRYILFHRNGVCHALKDQSTSPGEILIISRFLNLIFAMSQSCKNINSDNVKDSCYFISLTQLSSSQIDTFVNSLLCGLTKHLNNYYWTTVFVVFNQLPIIQYFCQSSNNLQLLKCLIYTKNKSEFNLIKWTLFTINHFIMGILEYISNNYDQLTFKNNVRLLRICLKTVILVVDQNGVNNSEIKTTLKILKQITDKMNNQILSKYFQMTDAFTLFKKLNTETILNNLMECLTFIRGILPFLTKNLLHEEFVEVVCRTTIELLQRTVDSEECLIIISTASEIVYYSSRINSKFFHSENNVKSIMSFMKILPSSVKHSDARLIIWWHILCSLPPEIFQNKFKQYFIPFLENILGRYLDSPSINTKSYGLSEFNLSNGHFNISGLSNYVMVNILSCFDHQQQHIIRSGIPKNLLIPRTLFQAKLTAAVFKFPESSIKEFNYYIIYAINIWLSIIRKHLNHFTNLHVNNHNKLSIKPQRKLKRSISNSCEVQPKKPKINHKIKPKFQLFDKEVVSNPEVPVESSDDDFYISEFHSFPCQVNSINYQPNDPGYLNLEHPHLKDNYTQSNVTIPSMSSSELQNIMQFFNGKMIPKVCSRRARLNPENLPLKKRPIFRKEMLEANCNTNNINDNDMSNSSTLSESDTTEKASKECPHNRNHNHTVIMAPSKSLKYNAHTSRYSKRSAPLRSKKMPQKSNATNKSKDNSNKKHKPYIRSYKAKLPKNNIDFTVNVTEKTIPIATTTTATSVLGKSSSVLSLSNSNRGNSNNDLNNSGFNLCTNVNKQRKIEFKLKFDMDPIMKLCGDSFGQDQCVQTKKHDSCTSSSDDSQTDDKVASPAVDKDITKTCASSSATVTQNSTHPSSIVLRHWPTRKSRMRTKTSNYKPHYINCNRSSAGLRIPACVNNDNNDACFDNCHGFDDNINNNVESTHNHFLRRSSRRTNHKSDSCTQHCNKNNY